VGWTFWDVNIVTCTFCCFAIAIAGRVFRAGGRNNIHIRSDRYSDTIVVIIFRINNT
jgi:hypothetical protein